MNSEYKYLLSTNSTQKLDTNIEYYIIVAMLNGYFQNKEILKFINKYQYIKWSTVEYNVKKLLKKFGVVTRSELFQKLLREKIITFSFNYNNLSNKIQRHLPM